jgi:hypothetical protein
MPKLIDVEIKTERKAFTNCGKNSPVSPEYDLYVENGGKSELRVKEVFRFQYTLTYQRNMFEY